MKIQPAAPQPTKEEYLAAVAKIERLSPAPMILAKALKLLRDPNSDLESITGLIRNDPALTGTILRVANSAFFGSGATVSSLEQAVQKIGFKESIRLLNLSVAHTLAARDLGSYGISAEEYWTECLCHGLFMEHLARVTGGANTDEAHTVGLLRFIGRLAINEAIHVLGGGLFWDNTSPIETWEMENVGFSQIQAAVVLLTAWKFPAHLIAAIQWQHEPQKVQPANWLAEALQFSTSIIAQDGGNTGDFLSGKEPISLTASTPFLRRHPLDAETLTRLVDDTRHSFAAVQHSLNQ